MSSSEIEKLAADWVAKVDAGKLTPEEKRALDAWLAADVRHLGAFARTAAAVASLDPLSAIGSSEVRRLCREEAPPVWTRRRLVQWGSGTGIAAAAGLGGVALWSRSSQTPDVARHPVYVADVNDYTTKIGATRVVALTDGSIATLNTDSHLKIRFTDRVREIHLVRGEALFNVAKNKARPFIVYAGDTRVRAVGTSFSVSFLKERPIRVLVQEGVVEVTRAGSGKDKPVLATANMQALVPEGAPIKKRAVTYTQVARDIAWQYGQISFDNQTLGAAAREFARYNNTKIIIDPAVANRTVTGLFPSDNPVGFAKAAAAALGLRVVAGEGEIQIIR